MQWLYLGNQLQHHTLSKTVVTPSPCDAYTFRVTNHRLGIHDQEGRGSKCFKNAAMLQLVKRK